MCFIDWLIDVDCVVWQSVKVKVIERSETARSSRQSSSEAVESSSTQHKIDFQPTSIGQVSGWIACHCQSFLDLAPPVLRSTLGNSLSPVWSIWTLARPASPVAYQMFVQSAQWHHTPYNMCSTVKTIRLTQVTVQDLWYNPAADWLSVRNTLAKCFFSVAYFIAFSVKVFL